MLTMPGPSSTRSRSRLRSGRASIAVTSKLASDVEPDRHHQVAEVFALDRLQQPGAERRGQGDEDPLAFDALDPLFEELGVEADLQRLALERGGHRLACVADI